MQGAKITISAREAIELLCGLLGDQGIQLSAETLRQAKFDGAEVRHGPSPMVSPMCSDGAQRPGWSVTLQRPQEAHPTEREAAPTLHD